MNRINEKENFIFFLLSYHGGLSSFIDIVKFTCTLSIMVTAIGNGFNNRSSNS